jgi:hypothetical protein
MRKARSARRRIALSEVMLPSSVDAIRDRNFSE